jgi:hypothetical protein
MTPITTYREDIELAIKRLDNQTVNGLIRARQILENILTLNSTKKNTGKVEAPRPWPDPPHRNLTREEIDLAFNIVSNVRNHAHTMSVSQIHDQMQRVCDILGPMYVEACNEETNRKAIIEILDILIDSSCNRGWDRTIQRKQRAVALKNKLEGE